MTTSLPFVVALKEKALKVLKEQGSQAAIDTFVDGLKSNEATQYSSVITQAKSPTFLEHIKDGNDEYDEAGLVALWIEQYEFVPIT